MSSRPPHRGTARQDNAAPGASDAAEATRARSHQPPISHATNPRATRGEPAVEPGNSDFSGKNVQNFAAPPEKQSFGTASIEKDNTEKSGIEKPSTEKLNPGAFAIGGAEIGPGVFVGARGIRIQHARGSGPGGQNVNKVNTKAEVWIDLSQVRGLNSGAMARLREAAGYRLTDSGELHIASDTHRTQGANRAAVFQRLREMIVAALVQPKRRRKTKPTRASRRKRLESKRHRGEIKASRRGAGD